MLDQTVKKNVEESILSIDFVVYFVGMSFIYTHDHQAQNFLRFANVMNNTMTIDSMVKSWQPLQT